MKSKVEIPEKFYARNLTITIESEEEGNALFAIFNHHRNTILLPENAAHDIRIALGSQFYQPGGVIANGITADQYYIQGKC